MTAQQQLAELNAIDGSWSDATEAKAAGWVDKNGNAVAELIAAVGKWRRAETKFKAAAAIEQIKTVHDKLTQDATT